MEDKSQSLAMLETVATFAPNDVNLLADKYGYYWPENNDQARMSFLATLWQDKGDRILPVIARIHPDRHLIIESYKDSKNKKNKKRAHITQSFDGTTSQAPIVPVSTGLTGRERLLIMIMILGVLVLFIKSK